MKQLRFFGCRAPLFLILLLSFSHFSSAQESSTVSVMDFEKASGSWQGSLIYLDYSSGQPFTLPANLEVKQIGPTNKFEFYNIFPTEPQANSSDTLVLSLDGRYIGKERVVSKKKQQDGGLEIVTEEDGKDGNDDQPATFRHTYLFSPDRLTMRKEVQFRGQSEWIKRNEFSYEKKTKNQNK